MMSEHDVGRIIRAVLIAVALGLVVGMIQYGRQILAGIVAIMEVLP